MNTCPKCGEQAASNYCPNCGEKMNVPAEHSKAPDASSYYTSQETAKNPPKAKEQANPAADPSQYKMGWHKWVIYFVLWFWAVVAVINLLSVIQIPSFAWMAIGYAAIAVGSVYVRFQLAKFKAGAPKKLLYLCILQLVWAVLSVLVYTSAMGTMDSTSGSSVFSILVWAIWNWRYYSSRSELFVN